MSKRPKDPLNPSPPSRPSNAGSPASLQNASRPSSQGRTQFSTFPSSSSMANSARRTSQRPDGAVRGSVAVQRHRASKGIIAPPAAANYHSAANTYYTLNIDGDDGGTNMAASHERIQRALDLRDQYKRTDKGQQESTERLLPPVGLRLEDGIFHFSGQRTTVVPWEQFYEDVGAVAACVQNSKCQAACRQRLEILEERFNIYKILNRELEESAGRSRQGSGIFSDSVKVDNFVLMPYRMNSQNLVHFIRETLETCGEDVVALQGDGTDREPITLSRVCEMLEIPDSAWLTGEVLGLQPSLEKKRIANRVDVLDPMFNSGGLRSAALLRLFLSRDTVNKGTYFAETIKPLLDKNEAREDTPQATETALDLNGLVGDEWEKLAQWLQEYRMLDAYSTNRWIAYLRRPRPPSVGSSGGGPTGANDMNSNNSFNTNNGSGAGGQASSLFSKLTSTATLENQQQQLENFFLPLFVATIAPEDPKNAHVATMLANMGGILVDCGEISSEIAKEVSRKRRRPVDVPWSENVSDTYFLYYVWANLTSLNALRRRRGFNTLQLRAVLPASTPRRTMAVAYLLCDHIVDGCALRERPVLQYLFGVHRIGISMSPLSTNGLGSVNFADHPFMQLFRRGLRVTLSTVTPLLTHCSREPLLEEYSAASRMNRMSGVDLCEVALNSVMMSSFPEPILQNWLGVAFVRDGWQGNNYDLTYVPTARLELRSTMWAAERQVLQRCAELVAQATAQPGEEEETGSVEDSSNHNTNSGDASAAAAALGGVATRAGAAGASNRAPYVVVDPHTYYPRLNFIGPYERDMQNTAIVQMLHRVLELRNHYMLHLFRMEDRYMGEVGNNYFTSLQRQDPVQQMELAFHKDANRAFEEEEWMFKTVEGVVVPHEVHQIPRIPQDMYHYSDFCDHLEEVRAIVKNVHVCYFANRRLQLLEHKFRMHLAVNADREAGSTVEKASQNRDFYQATKVDNTVRMETGMTARQLLNFIVSKAINNGDDIVSHRKGREPQTLRQLLHELHISPDTLTVDDLNVQVDSTAGGATESFYPNSGGELLTLLLKTENQMKGRYFAELTKLTFENLKRDRFTFSENRLPIYGASEEEWAQLSSWFDTHGMASSHNQWMVQVPRIYGYLRSNGKVESFAQYLENIFKPLWTVSLHPSKNPRLFHFVNHISGFDCVGDEGRPDAPLSSAVLPPHEWTSEEDPPYNYYMYYMWANIYSLNAFRRRRQFTTFTFRPSSGERGSVDHLMGGLLLGNSISYGVALGQEDGPLQYLFYLARIGVTLSPLSNNSTVVGYLENPFPKLFRRGLLVSLGTDSPLMYHHTQEPLIEEYSIASKIWKLSPNDMCEIARNSVMLSGFGFAFKQERLGERFFLSSSVSNDASRTHLSDIRVGFRFETYHSEVGLLEFASGLTFRKALYTLAEEEQWMQRLDALNNQQKDMRPLQDGLIDSNPDDADLNRLQQHRTLLQSQLEELTTTLGDLRRQNKQLSEKLAEERARDVQAAQLRRARADAQLHNLDTLQEQWTKPTTAANASEAASASEGSAAAAAAAGPNAAPSSNATAAGTADSLGVPAAAGLTSRAARSMLSDPQQAASGEGSSAPQGTAEKGAPPGPSHLAAGSALLGFSESLWSRRNEQEGEAKPAASSGTNGSTGAASNIKEIALPALLKRSSMVKK